MDPFRVARTGFSAGVPAVYDYYPFGMLMPERYVEDASQQCIPVTHTRYVKVTTPVYEEQFNNPGNIGSIGRKAGTGVEWSEGKEMAVLYPDGTEQDGGLEGTISMASSAAMDDPLTVITSVENLGGKDVWVALEQYTGGGVWEKLVQMQVRFSEEVRLETHAKYTGAVRVAYRSDRDNKIGVSAVRYITYDNVQSSYVTLSCNSDEGARGDYRFGFNGQHKDNEVKGAGNSLDFGARLYDSRFGRWNSTDPLGSYYSAISPYAFGLNSPIQYTDVDGRLVVYVNGEVGGFGGKLNWKSKANSQRASIDYWTESFVLDVQRAFGEPMYNRRFIDGDLSSGPGSRQTLGYRKAVSDFKDIIANMTKDGNGKINETIKVVSHSKGSAAANGYVQGLLAEVNKNQHLFADPDNVVVAHIAAAPHQSWATKVLNSNVATVGVTHWGDILSDDDLRGDAVTIETGSASWAGASQETHRVKTFRNEIVLLAQKLMANFREKLDKYNGLNGLLPNQKDYNAP